MWVDRPGPVNSQTSSFKRWSRRQLLPAEAADRSFDDRLNSGLVSNYKVLCARMVYHDGGRGLFRIEQESRGQSYSYRFLRMQQGKQLGLIFEIRTRGIAERVP